MCGLSGTFGDVSTNEEKAFKTLLIYSQIRGTDATGVGSVSRNAGANNNREIRLAKDVGPPYFLFDTKAFDKCFYGVNQAYIGHNRSKTTGDYNRKCAHPFLFDDVLGAHNGTIDYQNKNRMEKGSDFKTDSEAIFYNIQCHGIEDTIGRVEKTEAYALTWYDRRDNTMNFIRNDHRPLWYIYTKNRKTLFWASEYEILMAGCGRSEYRLDLAEKPYVVTPDTHYKWKIPALSFDELPEPERNKLENFKRVYTPSIWKNHGHGNEKKDEAGKSTNTIYNGEFGDSYMDDNEYWGNYCSAVGPKTEDTKAGIVESITEGINNLLNTASEVTTKVIESKVMSAEDVLKKHKLESAKKENPPEKFPQMYKSSNLVVHLDTTTGNWHSLRWNQSRGEWDKWISGKPPGDIPYTLLDIQARHNFKHEGKGKHKKILYKGFRGSLLNQDQFNKMMKQGCLQCDRVPEWGNEVAFLDDEHTFLCEWCKEIPNLLNDLIQKKAKVG